MFRAKQCGVLLCSVLYACGLGAQTMGGVVVASKAEIDQIRAQKTAPAWDRYNYAGQISASGPPSAKTSTNVYDPEWKTPAVNEFVLGYERQLWDNISIGVNGYVKKESRSLVTYPYVGTLDSYTVQWPWETQWQKMSTDPVTGNDVYTAVARPSPCEMSSLSNP